MTQALNEVMQAARQSGFVTSFNVVQVRDHWNCAVFQVTNKASEERPDPDLPRLMGIDSAIITGDTEDRRNETAFKVPALEAAGRRLVEPTRNLGVIKAGQAKRFFSESGVAVLYAATTDINYDPATDLEDKQVAAAVSAIGNAYHLATLAGAKRLLLPAGILFSDGGLLSAFDEARIVMMSMLVGRAWEQKIPEVVVLARNGMDQGAYTFVFEQVAKGNKDILSEPVTSTGYTGLLLEGHLRELAGEEGEAGLLCMALDGLKWIE